MRLINAVMMGLLGAWSLARAAPSDPLAPVGAFDPPAPAVIRPVTETLWGRKVSDDYRYMESQDKATIAWMKAQGAYTRRVLDSIAPLAKLRADSAAFSASFGLIQGYAVQGGRAFYEERPPGSDNFDLVVSDQAGTRKIVDVAALRAAHGGAPYAINYFLASPDGARVAVGVSAGGSEAAAISVYDAASGAKIAGPVDRAEFGATSWSADGRFLYFIRLKRLGSKDAPTEKYKDASADAWDLKSEPVPVLGSKVGHGPAFSADETPAIAIFPGAPLAAAISVNGVQNEWAIWLTPVAAVNDAKTSWTRLASREDGVTNIDMRGEEIFLLSHKDAPTFKVLSVRAGQPLSAARTLLPARADRVVEAIHAASDALYVLTSRGAYSELLRIATGSDQVEVVKLPFPGHITEAFTDPRAAGITVLQSSWVVPPTLNAYNPQSRGFTDLKIGKRGDLDAAAFVVSDLSARAKDATLVPLSLVRPAHAQGPQVTMIEAYGSYGISERADFSVRRAMAMRAGITYAVCHVRGGGELGEAWRLAGKDANKHNTWQDLIACSEFLVGNGTTTKDKLFIIGGSAGGITMGRAMTERPDLFAGVVDLVPESNTVRSEFAPSGPANIPEFGSVKDAAGFANLYEMDTVAHVRKGVQYPAILVTTGLNDPRVVSWQPAKLVATLQASGSVRPILMRIDAQAGHGIGSTKTQSDELYADVIAFVFWRSGLPEWRPRAATGSGEVTRH